MRSSMLLSLTAALFSIINGVHASPLAPRHDPDIIDECALPPHAHLGRRGPVKIPSGIHPAAKQFIEHMSKATIMHGPAPMFWAGKIDRTGALTIANKVKKVQAIVGTHGAHTVFDVLESEEASHFKGHTAQWKPGVEWAAVCAAFAEYSKPTGKKGFLVFGTEFDPDPEKNIWNNHEWPAVLENEDIEEVEAYLMVKKKEVGKKEEITWGPRKEIKRSGAGTPVHTPNTSPSPHKGGSPASSNPGSPRH